MQFGGAPADLLLFVAGPFDVGSDHSYRVVTVVVFLRPMSRPRSGLTLASTITTRSQAVGVALTLPVLAIGDAVAN